MLEDKRLDKDVPIPLYFQLEKLILEEIDNGNYPVGSMIPTEMELSQMFGISRTTVRQAISDLVREEHLYRIKSKGTFVAHPKLVQGFIQSIQSFDDDVRSTGRTPSTEVLDLKLVELKSFYEVLVGGRTFTALASQSLTLKELSNYPLISLSDESMTRSFYRQFFLDHDAVLRPDTEAATTDQMLTLVKSELGLAFVPEPMAKDLLARGELVQLHLQEIIPTRSICLVYDHHRPLNTAARKFQQMMTKADSPRPAASKQTESISFISQ